MPASLLDFAILNDAVAATSSKLRKQALLADYLRDLPDDDLRLAIRYAGGRAFAATEERVLNVGGAIVSDVLLSLLKLDAARYYQLVTAAGEIGEALSGIWPTEPLSPGADEPLLLRDLASAFDDLAATGVVERKRSILCELFARCRMPREAVYLAKIILGDLRTGVQEGVLQAAVAQAFDKPPAQIQRTQLLIGDLEEVAILARRDALATACFHLFHPIQFMLATPQETPQEAADTLAGRTFLAEDKLDGIRAQVHKSADGRIAIYTRTMDRTDECFPEVVAAMRNLPGEFLLDGEIVPWCDGCVLPFAHLQRRLGRKCPDRAMLRDNPIAFIAFDILYRDGKLLMDEPLRQRRVELEQLAAAGSGAPTIILTPQTPVHDATQIQQAFDAARARRNEGIVLKDPDSPCSPGRRGQMWLKLKTHLPTFDCVVTAAEYGHGKRRSVLSDYTFAVWDRDPSQPGAQLVNIGKAYSGLTDQEIAQLTELFLKLSLRQLGHVHIVQPKAVLEIACDQIQRSTRHASGYALRFPRIKRIRRDKRPEDADRLQRIAELYQSLPNFAYRAPSTPAEPAAAPEPTLFDHLLLTEPADIETKPASPPNV